MSNYAGEARGGEHHGEAQTLAEIHKWIDYHRDGLIYWHNQLTIRHGATATSNHLVKLTAFP